MIEHVVLFKMKPESTEADKTKLIELLRAMEGRIPGMEYLSAGESFSDRHQGFVIGLVTRFKSKADLEAYGPHPLHQPVVEWVKEVCEDVLAVDYETGNV